jgi:hypothetical protein
MVRICRRTTVGRIGAAIAVVVVGTLMAAHPASADEIISACVNPAGHVRLAPDGVCHGEEQLVTWSGDVASAPTVVDANGVRLGFFMGSVTLVKIGDDFFTASVGRNGFISPGSGVVFNYLTSDCAGQPYVTANVNALVAGAFVLANTAWFADLDAPPVMISGTPQHPGMYWGKQVGGPSVPPPTCFPILVTFGQVTLSPLKSVDVSGFVPPFRIK